MIDVKQATGIAMVYLKDLLKDAGDVTLEEVELSDDDKFWYITLSALVPAQVQPTSVLQSQMNMTAVAELFKPETHRVYKILAINADSGAVKNMKIRKTE